MRKFLTAGLAALTLGGALAAGAAPAQAAPYGWGGYHHGWGGGGPGLAVAAGILGLAAGAAIASNSHPVAYGPAYYGPPPPPAYGYGGVCWGRRQVWDPYIGGYVVRSFRYAC